MMPEKSRRLLLLAVGGIRRQEISCREAAEEVSKPCVCGIVNRDRAEEIFARLAHDK